MSKFEWSAIGSMVTLIALALVGLVASVASRGDTPHMPAVLTKIANGPNKYGECFELYHDGARYIVVETGHGVAICPKTIVSVEANPQPKGAN